MISRIQATVRLMRVAASYAAVIAVVAMAPVFASAQLPKFSQGYDAPDMFNPAGPNAASIQELFWVVIGICAIILGLVGTAQVWFAVRYREKPEDADSEPPQIYGSRAIEISWTLAPLLTVILLAVLVIATVIKLRADPPSTAAQRVQVVGHQWWWEYTYSDHGFTTANEMVIPVSDHDLGKPIYLQLESADVCHSFWVPRLAGKTDLIPGHTNSMWIQTSIPATYFGRCAEYCGTQHAKMLIRVNAVSQQEFDEWVEHQKTDAVSDESVSAGRNLFMDLACMSCHTIRGTQAVGKFGPELTHLMSRETICAGVVENNRENLTQWISNPGDLKKGCRMPDMRLTQPDVKLIVDYLLSLN